MTDTAPLATMFTVFGEIRRRILHGAIAVLIAFVGCFYISRDLLEILKQPFHAVMGAHNRLYFTAPSESMMAHLLVAFVAAVILVAPYLFLQLWWLASPVLYRTNRVRFVAFALTTAVTFVAGALFGYFGVLPEAINFLVRSFDLKTNFEAMLRISSFLSFALKLMLAFGLAFELPVIMFLLGRLGVVNARQLWRGGRYAVVIIFVAAAVLSPPDVITQLILAVPLCLLYLIGVAAVGLFGKRQKALA